MTGHDAEPPPEGPSRGALMALVAIVVLVVAGYWLAQHIRVASRIQDCVMAGRSNCAPIR